MKLRPLAWLLLGTALLWFASPTLAQASDTSEPIRVNGPETHISVVSVLTLAKNEAEKELNEETRRRNLIAVATDIRICREEDSFGSFVADMLGPPEKDKPTPRASRLAQAKQLYLAGDIKTVEQQLRECPRLIEDGQIKCPNDDATLNAFFHQWDLEAGRLVEAAERARTGAWSSGFNRLSAAVRTAAALASGGRSADAVSLLSALEANSSMHPASLAGALWVIGADVEAKNLLRRAITLALNAAEKDAKQPLPVIHARLQLDIGDRDGAIETLHRIARFAVPIDDDAPPTSSADLRHRSLTPASEQWSKARGLLVRLLARADLDDEAGMVVGAPLAGQPAYLRQIALGQADGGRFAAAFETIEKLRTAPGSQPRAAFSPAAMEVVSKAAKLGDNAAVRKATLLCSEVCGPYAYHNSLQQLAYAGRPDVAVEFALREPHIGVRIAVLGNIAKSLTLARHSTDLLERWYEIRVPPPLDASR